MNETEECPDHGEQVVVGQGSTRGPDPYAVDKLACGCDVACFGPGEPNVVIRRRLLLAQERSRLIAQAKAKNAAARAGRIADREGVIG